MMQKIPALQDAERISPMPRQVQEDKPAAARFG